MAKTIQWFNRTGSTQNRPRHGQPKKLSARAQHHMQRLSLGNRRMSAQTMHHTLHQIGLHGSSQKEASSKDDAQEI